MGWLMSHAEGQLETKDCSKFRFAGADLTTQSGIEGFIWILATSGPRKIIAGARSRFFTEHSEKIRYSGAVYKSQIEIEIAYYTVWHNHFDNRIIMSTIISI